MKILRRMGRGLLAPMFVTGGLDAVRHPEGKAARASTVVDPVAGTFGLPDDPAPFVRLNGGVQMVGGALLGLGLFTRLSAVALAASLVPTTLAGHPFWAEADASARATQRTQFLKNAAMLGGLLLVAADGA